MSETSPGLPKVLFISKWYPNKFDLQHGIFIEKHAKSLTPFCQMSAIALIEDSSPSIETNISDGIFNCIGYYKKTRIRIPVIRQAIQFIHYFKTFLKCYNKILKETGKPDIVHVNILQLPGLLAYYLYRLKKIPYVVTEQWSGYITYEYSDYGFFGKGITKLIIRNAKAIFTVSGRLRDAMLSHGLKNDYHVISNIVEKVPGYSFEPEPGSPSQILNISDMRDSKKNISGIIKAVSEVAKKNDQLELHILGHGKDKEWLMQMAEDLDLLNKQVFFDGIIPNSEVYERMQKIDFLITNSYVETFSVATAEAIASGKPVISTDCGGPSEFVTPECGLLIPVNDQSALEEAILKMMETARQYRKEDLMKYAASKFNYDKVGSDIYSVYKKVLKIN